MLCALAKRHGYDPVNLFFRLARKAQEWALRHMRSNLVGPKQPSELAAVLGPIVG
jgi:hypothetical protein